MEQNQIIDCLIQRGIKKLTAKTIAGTFSLASKNSLVAQQVHNRSSADWKKAQFIIVDDNDSSIQTERCIKGWKSMAEPLQFLIIKDGSTWKSYNYKGDLVPFNEILPDNNEGSTYINCMPFQKIFYGSPGTGKSFKVKKMLENVPEDFIFRTTFHPDSDYSSFVGTYKPLKTGNSITYDYEPQSFTKAYVKAWLNPSENIYLVIEEINRGNCAQIFGDLFQLLDRKNGISEYPVNVDSALAKYLQDTLSDESADGIADGKLKLPANLNIIATMNTSDQSLFPMDSAFKRRWDWVYIPTTPPRDDEKLLTLRIDNHNKDYNGNSITVGEYEYKWTEFLTEINKRISAVTHSDDKQLGFWFVKTPDDSNEISINAFVSKVVFYLWNDVFKDIGPKNDNPFKVRVNGKDEIMTFNSFFEMNSEGQIVENIGVLHTFMQNLGLIPSLNSQAESVLLDEDRQGITSNINENID